MSLVYIADTISELKLGNGTSVVIFAGIASALPGSVGQLVAQNAGDDPTNVLIMDEPTNHLDIASKNILKQTLAMFKGTLIVVSHDLEFLDGLTSEIPFFELRFRPDADLTEAVEDIPAAVGAV